MYDLCLSVVAKPRSFTFLPYRNVDRTCDLYRMRSRKVVGLERTVASCWYRHLTVSLLKDPRPRHPRITMNMTTGKRSRTTATPLC